MRLGNTQDKVSVREELLVEWAEVATTIGILYPQIGIQALLEKYALSELSIVFESLVLLVGIFM
jgi:hypothetical protein